MAHQLVYLSAARREFSTQELRDLLATARAHNAAADVTGLLLYSQGSFMQLLEGSEAAVLSTFARVERDRRHHRVVRMLERQVEERAFPDWSMGLRPLELTQLGGAAGVSTFLAAPDEHALLPDLGLRMLYGFREL